MKKVNSKLIVESGKKSRDIKEMKKQELVAQIQEESKELLLPTLKEKMEETTNLILDILKNKGVSKVNNIQIMSLIAQGSLLETATANRTSYSPQELKIGFNLYLDMINKINEVKPFPPTIESFTAFMGISRVTYTNWLCDPDRKDVMNYIHSYLLGVLATSTLTGELREISGIYLQKTMGKVETPPPIVIEHKKQVDIDTINEQLEALKGNKVIDAEYDE